MKRISKEQDIICIICPLGCLLTVAIDNRGDISDVANNMCKKGEKYAVAECKFPGRVLTTTVLVKESSRALLPVKSDKPIAKGKLLDCMRFLSKIKVRPPIKMGQVVVPDIAGTGVDLVATGELPM